MEVAKPLSMIYQQSWLTRKVPIDWKLVNVKPVYKKGQKRMWGTTGLSASPWCQGRLRSDSSRVPSHSMYRALR